MCVNFEFAVMEGGGGINEEDSYMFKWGRNLLMLHVINSSFWLGVCTMDPCTDIYIYYHVLRECKITLLSFLTPIYLFFIFYVLFPPVC
jgi:hypothetical protein